jgi:Tfp pilus assembly protein PilX
MNKTMFFRKNFNPPAGGSISNLKSRQAGTALLMTILILNSIILISLAAAKLVVSGVKMSGTQAQSTKAYFAAEAGAERVLYEYRKAHGSGCNYGAEGNCHFSKNLPNLSSYHVDYSAGSNVIFVSVGASAGMSRSVELEFDF